MRISDWSSDVCSSDLYTPRSVSTMITDVMRRAGFKAPTGRTGPRVHDLRHSMVVNRILQWYRAGVNPQEKLHFLSPYKLGRASCRQRVCLYAQHTLVAVSIKKHKL